MSEKQQVAKYEVKELAGFAIIMVVTALVIAFGQKILTDVQAADGFSCSSSSYVYNTSTGLCNLRTNVSNTQGASYEGNATQQGKVALGKFSDYLPTVAIVIVAGILIAILYNVFLRRA